MQRINEAIRRMEYLEQTSGIPIDNNFPPQLWDGQTNIAAFFVLAALVNKADYQRTAAPRARAFSTKYPAVHTVQQLHQQLQAMDDRAIAQHVLNWGWINFSPQNWRPQLLRGLVAAFIAYHQRACPDLSEQDAMAHWARHTPDGTRNPFCIVHQCGAKLIAWLKTFGAQMPRIMKDKHLVHGIEHILRLTWEEIPILCECLKISDYQLDQFFTRIMQNNLDIDALMQRYQRA